MTSDKDKVRSLLDLCRAIPRIANQLEDRQADLSDWSRDIWRNKEPETEPSHENLQSDFALLSELLAPSSSSTETQAEIPEPKQQPTLPTDKTRLAELIGKIKPIRTWPVKTDSDIKAIADSLPKWGARDKDGNGKTLLEIHLPDEKERLELSEIVSRLEAERRKRNSEIVRQREKEKSPIAGSRSK